LQKNQELWISGKLCSTGTVEGELPGKPVKMVMLPGEYVSDGIVLYTGNPQYANNVIESPGAHNGWAKTSYNWNPKFASNVTVKEEPNEQNQFNRVVLVNKNPLVSVIFIDWTLAN
jgi:hypothetical protein